MNPLIVRGDFTNVSSGDATKRTIGFGCGASDVKAHAVVSVLTTADPCAAEGEGSL